MPPASSSERIRLALPGKLHKQQKPHAAQTKRQCPRADVLQDKLLNSSQRLSAHSADLLSLKRSGGYSSALGVGTSVLKALFGCALVV
jgi:hypothetical protein